MESSLSIPRVQDFASYAFAYRKDVAAIFRDPDIQKQLARIFQKSVERFYDLIFHQKNTAKILARLTPDEVEHLKERQSKHIALLFSADVTMREHYERARQIGLAHEMIGLTAKNLLTLYHFYQREILSLLTFCREDARYERLTMALMFRAMLDMEAQSDSHNEVGIDVSRITLNLVAHVRSAETLPDLLRGIVEILSSLRGVDVCLVERVIPKSGIRTEAIGGGSAKQYEAVFGGDLHPIRMQADGGTLEETIVKAWRNNRPYTCASIATDSAWHRWQEPIESLHLRSVAAIPLSIGSTESFTLVLYSHLPGFFDTIPCQNMTQHILELLRHTESRFDLVEAKEKLEQALDASSLSMWGCDIPNATVTLDPHWSEITGEPPGETTISPWELISRMHPEDAPRIAKTAADAIHGITLSFQEEFRYRTAPGPWKWILCCGKVSERDANGSALRAVGTVRDITEHKDAEKKIHQFAYFDPLTKLPNRRLFDDRLQQHLNQASRTKKRLALLFIDIDRFKTVNDTYGHAIGDWLLQSVATRVQDCLRRSDTVARLGGDEFVALVSDTKSAADAFCVAQKIRASMKEPFVMSDGKVIPVSASIGIALYPDHAQNAHDLLGCGDKAMYGAKNAGRNAVEVFVD